MHKGFKKWDVPGLHQNYVTSSAPPNNNISQKPTLVALFLPYERKKSINHSVTLFIIAMSNITFRGYSLKVEWALWAKVFLVWWCIMNQSS